MFDFIIKENEGKPDRHLLHQILANQHFIISKLSIIMDQNADFSAALDKLDADIQAVADELKAISTTPKGGLTADQETALLSRISGQSAKLEALVVPATPAAPADGSGSTDQAAQ